MNAITTMNTEMNPMINSLWIIVLLCFVFCLLCYRCFTEKKQIQNDITELKSLLINREIELKKEMKEMKNEINDLKSLFLHFEVNLVELDKRENERWNKQINEDAPNLLTTILESNEMVMTKIEQDKQYQEKERKYEKELNEMIMNEIHNLKVEMNKHENDKHDKQEQEKEEDRLKNEMDIALYNLYNDFTPVNSFRYNRIIEIQEDIQHKIDIVKHHLATERTECVGYYNRLSLNNGVNPSTVEYIVLNNKICMKRTYLGGNDQPQHTQKITEREKLRIKNRDDYLISKFGVM